MQVFGDARLVFTPTEAAAELRRRRTAVAAARGAFDRHAARVALLLTAAEIAQGAVDASTEPSAMDDASEIASAAEALLLAVAHPVVDSWNALQGGADVAAQGDPSDATHDLDAAVAAVLDRLPASITATVPEGYAHYGLYVETYIESAKALRQCLEEDGTTGATSRPLVVGLRSIGASLGAVVACVLDGDFVTVRPRGEAYHRALQIGPSLAQRLEPLAGRPVVLVDEGPGISGSSLGGAADWFEDRGAAVHVLPSHRGELGSVASPRHRERWSRSRRIVTTFDDVFVTDGGSHALAEWFAPETGGGGRLEPLHGDGWRRCLLGDSAPWPAGHPQQERTKYRLDVGGASWLLKNAGLGASGEGKLQRARQLAAAGFCPKVHSLRHGYMRMDWHSKARPLRRGEPWPAAWLERLGAYLRFRCDLAPPRAGADVARLHSMMMANTEEALGPERASALGGFREALPELASSARPVATDNKMQPWEWIALPDGHLLKCDATDHTESHDLIGAQDIAWDIVAAGVELGLDPSWEEQQMGGERAWTRLRLSFYRTAYLAFSLGRASFAGACCTSDEERRRWQAEYDRYVERLASELDAGVVGPSRRTFR